MQFSRKLKRLITVYINFIPGMTKHVVTIFQTMLFKIYQATLRSWCGKQQKKSASVEHLVQNGE